VRSQIIKYRVDKITELHDRFLKRIYDFARDRNGYQVIVTAMDSHNSPEMVEDLGLDTETIIGLQKKYGFLLQIEDPQNKWSTNPARYLNMGQQYAAKLGGEDKLLLDLNILNFRNRDEITPFPTLIQTGIESYQLIRYSALGANRFTIYGEATVNPQDLSFFAYASSSRVKYTNVKDGYEVESPHSFVMKLPKSIKVIKVDDKNLVGCRNNIYVIPAGKHLINIRNTDLGGFNAVELQPQIVSFTGNILDVNYGMRKIWVKYESNERALISVNSGITTVRIDGQKYPAEPMKGNDCNTIYLPPGTHEVDIETVSSFVYGIDLTSFWSTKFIALFGSIAVSMLLVMYFVLKYVRRRFEVA